LRLSETDSLFYYKKFTAMKHYLIILAIVLSPSVVPGCEELLKNLPVGTQTAAGLSGQEIIEGLKTALVVGTDSSVYTTSRKDGFYRDEAIKILLPPEAQIIYENRNNSLLKVIGIDKKIEDAVLALNRAAEDAAKEAGPVFKNAVTGLSITEGMSILKGKNPLAETSESAFDSTAATAYLRSSTYNDLKVAFAPKVNTSLDKVLVGNLSPNEIWDALATNYNKVASKSFGLIEPMKNPDLGSYVTEKALEGLFLKVSDEEIKIRRDPGKWATTAAGNILQRVFGSQKQFLTN